MNAELSKLRVSCWIRGLDKTFEGRTFGHQNVGTVKLLISKGADVAHRDKQGDKVAVIANKCYIFGGMLDLLKGWKALKKTKSPEIKNEVVYENSDIPKKRKSGSDNQTNPVQNAEDRLPSEKPQKGALLFSGTGGNR
jgi:hypothetical protein